MPNSKLPEFIRRLEGLEKKMTDHLIESGGIKNQLKVNTAITALILTALLAQFVTSWLPHR